MLIKQKSPFFPRNLALRTFGELPIVFWTKLNLLYLLYSTDWRCLSFASNKAMAPECKNVGERSLAKNYRPVSLLSVVSEVFEKRVNDRIADHLEKCGLFSDFQYGFRSS